MTTKPTLHIGLFGFGTVGEGLYHVLDKSRTVNARIERICVKNPDKERSLPADAFTTDSEALLQAPDINLIVELINDPEEAYTIVTRALKAGKSVVSGNKTMIAQNLPELIRLQEENHAALLYDASACGSIPVIRNIEEYYDNDLLTSVTGILNGSSNYILSKIFNEGSTYETALQEAQQKGFAESNPSFDVDGQDALYKLVIIATHAFGTHVPPENVFTFGISNLQQEDIRYAREKQRKIKLVAQLQKDKAGTFTLFVMPKLVPEEEYIYNVEEEYNGVVIEGEFYEKQFMFGKGAGAYPTGSAVLSDITARSHNYRYEYKKMNYFQPPAYTTEALLDIYLRFENILDFSYFDFDQITEKFTGSNGFNYVRGKIRLKNLLKIQPLLKKLNVFMAFGHVEP